MCAGGRMEERRLNMKVIFETTNSFFHGLQCLLFGEIECLGSFSHG